VTVGAGALLSALAVPLPGIKAQVLIFMAALARQILGWVSFLSVYKWYESEKCDYPDSR